MTLSRVIWETPSGECKQTLCYDAARQQASANEEEPQEVFGTKVNRFLNDFEILRFTCDHVAFFSPSCKVSMCETLTLNPAWASACYNFRLIPHSVLAARFLGRLVLFWSNLDPFLFAHWFTLCAVFKKLGPLVARSWFLFGVARIGGSLHST